MLTNKIDLVAGCKALKMLLHQYVSVFFWSGAIFA